MPKVNITEIDNTVGESTTFDNYVVLILGKINENYWTAEDIESGALVRPGKFFRGKDTDPENHYFEDLFPEDESGIADYGYGYWVARQLAKKSNAVILYVPVVDGTNLKSPEFWERFTDKGAYDLRFITTSEFTDKEIAEKAIWCAATRGDAVACVDIPDTLKKESNIRTWLNTFNDITIEHTSTEGVKTEENAYSYAACFGPGKGTKAKGLLDTEEFATTFAYLSAFFKSIERFPEWFAASGSQRGVLPYTDILTQVKFGDNAINKLQPRSSTTPVKSCNVLCEIKPYGNIIWGNRTMLDITSEGLRAGHFLNIRQLCCILKKTLYRAARKFSFEPNSDVLWANFCGEIRPLLEEMRTGQGIRGYKIIRKTTNKKALLVAVIKIVPIEAVEDFDLTVTLEDSIEVTE